MLATSDRQRDAIPAALTNMSPARDDPNARSYARGGVVLAIVGVK
jgi:hypothetical protein